MLKESSSESAFGDVNELLEENEPTVEVLGKFYRFKDGIFNKSNFYVKYLGQQDLICWICKGTILHNRTRLTCIFC